MDKNREDDIMIFAFLKRFTEIRLPRALDLEKKVLAGGTLDDSELAFLDLVFKEAKYILPYSDKHPEYKDLVSKALQLYIDITQKALENQNKNT